MMKALMKKRMQQRLQKRLLLASAVTAACVACLILCRALFRERRAIAEIYHKTRLVKRIDLSEAEEGDFTLPSLPNVVFRVYDDGSIAFVRSDCPDQICVQTGKLSRRGQIAACLTNEVYIRIVSPSEVGGEETDIVLDEEAGPLDDAGHSYDMGQV
jgi:hypothetical protein